MMKGEQHAQEQQDDISHHHNHNHNISSTSTNPTTQNTSSTQIYPTYQTHPHFLTPPPHYIPPHFQNTQNTPIKNQPQTTTTTTSSEDGGTIVISRRPRGRPPGSKNKPKPPIIITTTQPETVMAPYILELQSGSDLVASLTRFTRRRNVGLCVLNATGTVANVSLKQPSTSTPGGTVTFHGRFEILSLSACIMTNTPPFNTSNNNFAISLAGPQGQIVGGRVVGSLMCAGTVYVIATSFNNPSYCRLPVGEVEVEVEEGHNRNYNEEGVTESDRITGCGGGGGGQVSSPVSEGGGGGTHVGLYGSSEVMWGHNASESGRPSQAPY